MTAGDVGELPKWYRWVFVVTVAMMAGALAVLVIAHVGKLVGWWT